MKRNITLIDYGVGNLESLRNAFDSLGYNVSVSSDRKEILASDSMLLPGVGAFGRAMVRLKEHQYDEVIKEFINSGKPVLGICLGMQLLFQESEEFGNNDGLGVLKGHIKKLKSQRELKLPHISWASLSCANFNKSKILNGLNEKSYFYFVHSYCYEGNESTLAQTTYGEQMFSSVVNSENVFGCQFHPEKSGVDGLKILDNFMNLKL